MDQITKALKNLHLAQLAQKYENMGYIFEEYTTIKGLDIDAYATNGVEELIFMVVDKDTPNIFASDDIRRKYNTRVTKFPNAKVIISPITQQSKSISFNDMLAVKPYEGNLIDFVIPVNNYTSLQYQKFENGVYPAYEVKANEIKRYVDLDQLNDITKSWLSKQGHRISNFSIHKLIEKNEISGSLYKVLPQFANQHPVLKKDHYILHLDSDSDHFRTTFCFFIDLFTGETFIGDM